MRPCFLCQCPESEVVEKLTGSELRKLWDSLGFHFSAEAWGALAPEVVVERRRCARCGFSFFDPDLGGGSQFYAELDRGAYYVGCRPEFLRALDRAKERGFRTVLDVGCGGGQFLDLAREQGMQTSGIELNAEGAKEASAKGHRVYSCLLEDLAHKQPDTRFDLICFFQVLEHVPDPAGLLRQALCLLSPGGLVSVAVPNDPGLFCFCPLDPHNWPPHHLSRWRRRDLLQMGRSAGARVCAVGGDPLHGRELGQFWKKNNQLARAIGRTPFPRGDWFATAVSQAYRKTGMRHLFRNSGMSLYAFYTRPS